VRVFPKYWALDEVIANSSLVDIQKFDQDETLPNFVKRNHTRKGEKKNKGQGQKSRQANRPKEAGHKEEREPLSTETSTSCLNHINSTK
jgi:hypothetical protein